MRKYRLQEDDIRKRFFTCDGLLRCPHCEFIGCSLTQHLIKKHKVNIGNWKIEHGLPVKYALISDKLKKRRSEIMSAMTNKLKKKAAIGRKKFWNKKSKKERSLWMSNNRKFAYLEIKYYKKHVKQATKTLTEWKKNNKEKWAKIQRDNGKRCVKNRIKNLGGKKAFRKYMRKIIVNHYIDPENRRKASIRHKIRYKKYKFPFWKYRHCYKIKTKEKK